MLNYVEPVNSELTARKTLSNLKQMGSLNAVRAYNKEFSKWLLQIPTMTPAEQIFHYSQGPKHRTKIEVKRSELWRNEFRPGRLLAIPALFGGSPACTVKGLSKSVG